MLNIGSNIAALRKARGLTQAQLAKKINRDRTVVTKYESGDVEVSAEMASIIARALNASVADVIEGSKKSA